MSFHFCCIERKSSSRQEEVAAKCVLLDDDRMQNENVRTYIVVHIVRAVRIIGCDHAWPNNAGHFKRRLSPGGWWCGGGDCGRSKFVCCMQRGTVARSQALGSM